MSSFDKKLFKALVFEIFFLIALGGGVRAMNAGLACPDWPLCFGQFIPDYHPEVYFEFIHRALAGIIGIVSTYLNFKIMRSAQYPRYLRWLAFLASVLLLAQIVLGGLTVLLLLHNKVVTAHLALGTAFYAITLWLYLSVCCPEKLKSLHLVPRVRMWSVVVLLTIYGQIILGGLVASNYAATSCPDFPLCNGQWIPTLSGPVGIHVMHRLWAYVVGFVVLAYAIFIQKSVEQKEIKFLSRALVATVFAQIGVGIANVLFAAPPLLTVTHLALATLLLGIITRVLWLIQEPKKITA